MCNANIGMGMQLGGGIFSAIQANRQGQAAQAYYNYLSQQTDTNAKSTMDQLYRQGGTSRSYVAQKAAETLAKSRAAMAANGIDATSGTYDDIIRDSQAQSTLDELAVEYSANEKAREVRQDAYDQMAGYEAAGTNAAAAGKAAMWGGLMSTAGQFASSWDSWRQTSMGKSQSAVKVQTPVRTRMPSYTSPKTAGLYTKGWGW